MRPVLRFLSPTGVAPDAPAHRDAGRVLTDWQAHYNDHRPHQGRQQQAPNDIADRTVDLTAPVQRRPVLGGLINEYHRAA